MSLQVVSTRQWWTDRASRQKIDSGCSNGWILLDRRRKARTGGMGYGCEGNYSVGNRCQANTSEDSGDSADTENCRLCELEIVL